jgi:hypothetical protein
MSLNNIKLPASVVSTLYKSVLVETTSKPENLVELPGPEIEKFDNEWKFLGTNQKNILLIVNNPGTVHLPDNELAFLTAILTACKLHLGDVAIINFNNYKGIEFKDIIKQFSTRIVLLFDVSPELLGLPVIFPHFQVQQNAGLTFLYSPSVADLENDKVLKSKLWVSLRRLFNV